jgi:hypothetical protein
MAAQAAKNSAAMFESYEDLSVADRCLLGFNAGPPMVSGTYDNNLQIVQTPGYVVIFNEMVRDARIVPTDGCPHGTLARLERRLARPLGRRHARRRDRELQAGDQPSGLDRQNTSGGTLHALIQDRDRENGRAAAQQRHEREDEQEKCQPEGCPCRAAVVRAERGAGGAAEALEAVR